jgi:serine/threonine-protein kinase
MPGPLAQYELLRVLGSGSTGVTHRARDLRSGDTVALRLIHPRLDLDPDMSDRLRHEARIAAQLRHENIAHIVEAGEDAGQTFIASEFVQGVSLRQRLQRAGRLSEAQTHRIALGIAHALNAAHTLRVTHGDLTPDNVLLNSHGDVRVCDFSLTHALDAQTLTRVVAFIAHPAYTAPEVDERRGDIRSDLYSLGVIMYEALTGRPPFGAASRDAIMRAHAATAPDLAVLQRAGRSLAPVVSRLLEKDPRDRFADPAELLDALYANSRLASTVASDEALSPRLLHARGPRARLHVRRHVGEGLGAARHRLAIAVAAAVAIASVAAAVVVAGAVLPSRAAVAAGRRVWAAPRAVKVAGASAVVAVTVLGGGSLLIASATGGRGGGEKPPLVVSGESPPATHTRTVPATRTAAAAAEIEPSLTAGSPPPSGTVSGAVAPPPTRAPIGTTRNAASARTPALVPPPPPPATPPPGVGATMTSTPVPAAPTSTPRPPAASPTPSAVPPSPTPTPPPTLVPTPGPVTITVVTDASWAAYFDWNGSSAGNAQVVCLRRTPSPIPAACPGGATSFNAVGSFGWATGLGSAQWIWAPGITAASGGPDGDRFIFERCFDVPGTPSAGIIEVAADRFADVWVNDQLLTTITGPNAAKNVAILPYLQPGANCIAFQAENDFVCGSGCTYQQNPAGLIARVSITYLPN